MQAPYKMKKENQNDSLKSQFHYPEHFGQRKEIRIFLKKKSMVQKKKKKKNLSKIVLRNS